MLQPTLPSPLIHPAERPWLAARVAIAALVLAVPALLILPLLVVEIPPMSDYPAHFARMYVLMMNGADTLIASHYVPNIHFQPDLAMDVTVPWLASLIGFGAANKLFLIAAILGPVAGVAVLQRSLTGGWSPWALLAALFAYNGIVLDGFVNFQVGVTLAMLAAAVWASLRERSIWLRLAVQVPLCVVVYFAHLFGLLAYGVIVFSLELERLWRERKLGDVVALAVPFVVPVALFVLKRSLSNNVEVINYGTVASKLRALLTPLLNHNLPLDVASLVFLVALAAIGLRAGVLRLERRLLPALAMCAVGTVVLPWNYLQSGYLDHRVAVLGALLFVAALRVERMPPRTLALATTAILALFCLRMGVLTADYVASRADLAEFRELETHITPGSTILVAYPSDAWPTYWRQGPEHRFTFINQPMASGFVSLAVMDRGAFVSTMFAHPGKHSIAATPADQGLVALQANVPTMAELAADRGTCAAYWCGWRHKYDYVVLTDAANPHPLPGADLTSVYKGDVYELFRVNRPPAG